MYPLLCSVNLLQIGKALSASEVVSIPAQPVSALLLRAVQSLKALRAEVFDLAETADVLFTSSFSSARFPRPLA